MEEEGDIRKDVSKVILVIIMLCIVSGLFMYYVNNSNIDRENLLVNTNSNVLNKS